MTTPRRLFSNTVVAVIGSVLQRLLSFATTMLLARRLGGELFGVYAFVGAYMNIFTFFVDLGFERVITREVARQPEQTGKLLGTGFILRGSLSLLAAAIAVVTAWLLQLPSLTLWCIFVAALGLPLSVETFVRAFYQSRFEVHYAYMLSLPSNLAFLLVAAVILGLGGGLIEIFLAALATGGLSLTLVLWLVLPQMRVVWRLDWELVRSLWRESWQLGAVLLIWLITLRIDQLLLYWLRGAGEVGLYAVAVKITEALNLIPESIMMTVFPLLAATDRSAPLRSLRIYRVTLRYLTVLVLPLALLVTLERELLIRLLFGQAYAPASGALTLLAWWMFFSYTGAVYVSLMVVRSQQRLLAVVSGVALAANVGLNLLWIPRWGATGAAAATLASNALSFLLFCMAPQSRSLMLICCQAAIRPLAAMAVSVVAVGIFAPAELHVVLAPLLYAVLLVALGGVERQDWALARELLRPASR